jgi:hypothetical protein
MKNIKLNPNASLDHSLVKRLKFQDVFYLTTYMSFTVLPGMSPKAAIETSSYLMSPVAIKKW